MKLFLDFDDTVVDSTKVAIDYLNKKYGKEYSAQECKRYDFRDLFPMCSDKDIDEIFNNENFFNGLELYDGVKDGIGELVKLGFKVTFATIGKPINLEFKKKYIEKNITQFANFMGIIENNTHDKSCVDMSGGIFIDDNIKCLKSSNATIKILIQKYPNGEWNRVGINDEIFVVSEWSEILDMIKFIIKNDCGDML